MNEIQLGDTTSEFKFNQTEIQNINFLLKGLKARLNSGVTSKDVLGEELTVDIYSLESLVTFLCCSLSSFNEIPLITNFTFSDTKIVNCFSDILIQGAIIYALASRALIQRGKEYQITNSGISVTLPAISEFLQDQYKTELNSYMNKLFKIKEHMSNNEYWKYKFQIS